MTIQKPEGAVSPLAYFKKAGEEFYLEKEDGYWTVSCLREGGTVVAWRREYKTEERARQEFDKHK